MRESRALLRNSCILRLFCHFVVSFVILYSMRESRALLRNSCNSRNKRVTGFLAQLSHHKKTDETCFPQNSPKNTPKHVGFDTPKHVGPKQMCFGAQNRCVLGETCLVCPHIRTNEPCTAPQECLATLVMCALQALLRDSREVGGWVRDPKKYTRRDWGMGSSTI